MLQTTINEEKLFYKSKVNKSTACDGNTHLLRATTITNFDKKLEIKNSKTSTTPKILLSGLYPLSNSCTLSFILKNVKMFECWATL
jgi:hypothetical protein